MISVSLRYIVFLIVLLFFIILFSYDLTKGCVKSTNDIPANFFNFYSILKFSLFSYKSQINIDYMHL